MQGERVQGELELDDHLQDERVQDELEQDERVQDELEQDERVQGGTFFIIFSPCLPLISLLSNFLSSVLMPLLNVILITLHSYMSCAFNLLSFLLSILIL